MDGIPSLVALYLLFLFSTTCHEAAHAFAAHRGGDDTAHALGHVSLDPTPHILRSPWGMVVFPLIGLYTIGFPFGWASVPYDAHWGRRHPLRQAGMSLAGPLANFSLALLAILTLRALIAAGVYHLNGTGVEAGFVFLSEGVPQNSPLAAVAFLLSHLFTLNLLLGLFNLMPFPPLDGAGVAEGVSPRFIGALYARLREIPGYQFLGWIAASQLFRYVVTPMNQLIALGLGLG